MSGRGWIALWLLVVIGFQLGLAPLASAQKMEAGQEQKVEGKKGQVGVGYVVGSVFATLVNVPLKIGLCGASFGIATVLFVASLGTADRLAGEAVKEGCRGPYVITPKRLKGEHGRLGS
ncbi:MAG: hypothetical protein ACK4Z6_02630 [Candidatus Methylomirabilales bacterium]